MNHRPDKLLLYIIIKDRLKQKNPVTLKQLRQHCIVEFYKLSKKQLVVTEEALQQDIVILKSLFQLPILKSVTSGGLYMNTQSRSFLDIHKAKNPEHQRFLFKYVFGVSPPESVYYHVQTLIYSKGWKQLIPISLAITEKRKLLIQYRSDNGNLYPYELFPYRLICENLQWYLVAHWVSENVDAVFSIRKILPGIQVGEVVMPESMPLNFHLHKEKKDIFSE